MWWAATPRGPSARRRRTAVTFPRLPSGGRGAPQGDPPVDDDATVTTHVAEAPPVMPAMRDLPGAPVAPGAQFTVGMTADDYGTFGQIVETLPAGFAFVDSSLDPLQVQVNGQDVTFVLLGETNFTYDVNASVVPGVYNFAGILTDEEDQEGG